MPMKSLKLVLTLISCAFLNSLSSQNLNVSNGFIFDGEPFITSDPINNNHLIAAWMGFKAGENIIIKTKVSNDGGATWGNLNEISHTGTHNTSADPSLMFDHQGNLFLAYIDYASNFSSGVIYTRKSLNGGITWNAPVEAINVLDDPGKYCIDRPWIAIDTSSGSNQGNVYVSSMNAKAASTPPFNPYVVHSIDGGASYQNYRYIDTTGYLAGNLIQQPMPTPTVSANGTFHAIYPSYVPAQNLFPRYILASGSNGVIDLDYHTAIIGNYGSSDTLIKGASVIKSNPSNPQHIILAGIFEINNDPDVYLTESFDEGVTWGAPQRVNDDPINNGVLQDLVWADFDWDGDLVVAWRDRRNATGTGYDVDTEIMGATRHKDSASFSTNYLISDAMVAHDTILEESGNDFMSLVLRNDTVSAVWGDVRTGRVNIWFNRFSIFNPISSAGVLLDQTAYPTVKLSPNPTTNELIIDGFKFDTYQIFSINGALIQSGKLNADRIDGLDHLEAGQYILSLKKGALVWRDSFVKI